MSIGQDWTQSRFYSYLWRLEILAGVKCACLLAAVHKHLVLVLGWQADVVQGLLDAVYFLQSSGMEGGLNSWIKLECLLVFKSNEGGHFASK